MGNPGFPIPPFASGVAPPGGIDGYREHRLLEQGHGETGFPHAPTRGRVWEGAALPGTTFFHCGVVRRSRMDGYREHRLLTYAHAALTPS